MEMPRMMEQMLAKMGLFQEEMKTSQVKMMSDKKPTKTCWPG
jgi:hypothetical protein